MSKLKTSLKRKVMGMPVWAWLAVVGGAIVLGLYLRRRNAANADNSGMDSTDMQSLGDIQDTGPIPGTAGGGPGAGGIGGGGGEPLPVDIPPASLPSQIVTPSFGDYGFPVQDNGPILPAMLGDLSTVPAPTSTGAAAHSPATSYQYASLASGAQLRFNPLTGIVTEKAPGAGATWYQVKQGVTDFAAYVAGVRSKSRTPSSSGGTKTAPAPTRQYYTYRKDVPLRPGQTIHFLAGKGYYAA